MGIVFFQLMIGQVPSGDVIGVLQTTGENEEVPVRTGCRGCCPLEVSLMMLTSTVCITRIHSFESLVCLHGVAP